MIEARSPYGKQYINPGKDALTVLILCAPHLISHWPSEFGKSTSRVHSLQKIRNGSRAPISVQSKQILVPKSINHAWIDGSPKGWQEQNSLSSPFRVILFAV